jgi:release factor glutamine methyltransferase
MKTPLYSLTSYPSVYDPSEDSFLLLDALESVNEELKNLDPVFILELGSGSGIVSTFISQLLQPMNPIIISTDINLEACQCTLNTSNLNAIQNIQVINGPGLSYISPSFYGKFDIIIFNPPYVVTSPEEISDYSRAWAGGINGRQGILLF